MRSCLGPAAGSQRGPACCNSADWGSPACTQVQSLPQRMPTPSGSLHAHVWSHAANMAPLLAWPALQCSLPLWGWAQLASARSKSYAGSLRGSRLHAKCMSGLTSSLALSWCLMQLNVSAGWEARQQPGHSKPLSASTHLENLILLHGLQITAIKGCAGQTGCANHMLRIVLAQDPKAAGSTVLTPHPATLTAAKPTCQH